MDTWIDRKFSNRELLSKGEKSYHTHMKQIISPLTILEFTWLVIEGFIEENGLAFPLPKSYKMQKKCLVTSKKIFTGGGESIYWKRDNQEVVRVGNQKWEIVEITIGIFFFAVVVWDLYSLFFMQGLYNSHLKKHHPHLKCQHPLKIPDLT